MQISRNHNRDVGNLECVKLLHEANASWTIKSEDGRTANDFAVKNKQSQVIAFFKNKDKVEEEEEGEEEDDVGGDGESKYKKKKAVQQQPKSKISISGPVAKIPAAGAPSSSSTPAATTSSATAGVAALSINEAEMWPEIQAAIKDKKHQLSITIPKSADKNAPLPALDLNLFRCAFLTRLQLSMPKGTFSTITHV